MEKIEITTRFSREGKLIPIEFRIGYVVIGIQDIGRQWESEGGRHILVMDHQEKAYHLFFDLADLNWYLIRDLKGPTDKI